MKKLEPPKFNGSVRAFPSFIRDFERLVVAQHGEDPYVLRISLEGEPRRLVEDLDDYNTMWERLYDVYGNEGKLIDAILGDIRSYKPLNDGEDRKLISLINTVEKVWLDVNNLKLTKELENTTVLTQVERLLPLMLKREWAIKVQELQTDKFKNLVTFLTGHRKALEYLQDDSRKTVTTKVAVHTVDKDPTKESDVLEAIRLLTVGQERLQNQMSECLTSLSRVREGKYQGRSQIAKFNGERKFCPVHDSESHEMQDCTTFQHWTAENQMEFLRQKGICFACLKRGHLSRECDKKFACRVRVNGDVCGKHHHSILHPLFTSSQSSVIDVTSNYLSKKGALLMTGFVACGGTSIPTLYDAGSNISLITFRMAKKLGLKGVPIHLSMTKVGNHTEELDSIVYEMCLRDQARKEKVIEVCGISEITVAHHQVDLSSVAKKLEVLERDIQRPEGRIELLIGSDYCTLMPQVIKTVDNVQLMSNEFGFCIRGRVEDQGDERRYQVQINHVSYNNATDWDFTNKPNVGKLVEQYFLSESLGTECIPKCGGCKCGGCSTKGNLTIQEEREMKLIEDGLTYDEQNHCWTSRYPWTSDPTTLPNNVFMAFARLKATERRLMKRGAAQCAKYQEQIQDMLDRGVAEKLSEEEFTHTGPTFYLPHHEVYKADSTSTPIRIVFNAAASYQGFSLNNMLAKGPDVINNLVGILLRFREEEVGMVGDIRKMYNTVKLSEEDMHTHRFLWRDFKVDKEPTHYKLKTVTFGDKPSGSIAMLALRKTAELNDDFPLASKIIAEDSYVDDIISSVNSRDCAMERINEIDYVLRLGGFQIKYWVLSGEGDDSIAKVLNTDQEKVLGLGWKPKQNIFSFKVKLNFSKKTREGRLESDVTYEDFESHIPRLLTRRSVLSQFATLYDPLGLLTPFTLKTKLMMRSIIMEVSQGNSKGWDEPLSENLYSETLKLFGEMFEIEKLSFRRCIKPTAVIKDPEMIIFCDSSKKAYGAVAYVRWEREDGGYHVNILCSKNRIAPMRQLSIPRLELCAAVLAVRLRVTIEKEMRYKFSKTIHITDSEIVRAQIQKESYRFNTFVGTRVAEIQSKSEPTDWYWVSSKENSADLTTRECNPTELDIESVWQRGPEFLYQEYSEWPVKQTIMPELPDVVFAKVTLNTGNFTNQLVDVHRFSNMRRLLSVIARVMNAVRRRSLKAISCDPSTEDVQRAELYLVKNAQASLPPDWEKRYKRLGPKMREDGIITVGSRMAKWLKDDWNCSQFILLPPKDPFSELYLSHIHNEDHCGVESSLARVQVKYWILGARKTMKSIRKRCVLCRRIDKFCTSQCMGELPKERLQPCPPWYNVSVDLFGPFWVCDTVKRRVKKKVFGVIFSCMVTRSVHLDISEGYDTRNFLTVLKKFTCLRGFPKKLYSDNGTQLVSANKEMREMVIQWNKKEIFNFGKFKGLSWVFNKSADAPWENACSESLIRLVKRSLTRIIGDSVVSFGELQAVMYEVANVLNERPIGFKPGENLDEGTVLRPNDLLLGRSTIEAPCGFWEESINTNRTHAFKIKIVDLFWKKWMKNYFPTLIVRQKWHVSKRNVQKGDIVLVNDQNVLRGEWKLAQVVDATHGRDGKTRDVILRYKRNDSGNYVGQRDMLLTRSVHRLVVILPVEEQ